MSGAAETLGLFDILLEAEKDKDHNSAVSEKDLRRVVLDQYIECQAVVPELRTWAENFSHRPKTDPSQAVSAIRQRLSKESGPHSLNDSLKHLHYAACVSSGVKPFSLGHQFLLFRGKPELLYGIRLTERFFRPLPSAKSIISDFNAAQCWKEIRSELSDAEAHLFLYAAKTAVRTSELLATYSSFRASFLSKAQISDLSKLKETDERLMPLKQMIDYASGIETEIKPDEIHRSIPAMATNSADISELTLHYRQHMPIVISHLPEAYRIVLCDSLSAAAVYANGAIKVLPNLRALLYKLPDSHSEAFAFADACMKCFGYLAQDLEAMVS